MVALGTPRELKDSISDTQVVAVKAKNLTIGAIGGLREIYWESKEVEDKVEVKAKPVAIIHP